MTFKSFKIVLFCSVVPLFKFTRFWFGVFTYVRYENKFGLKKFDGLATFL